jgi:hypothetical protein
MNKPPKKEPCGSRIETEIHNLWMVKTHLDVFLEMYCDSPRPMTEDQVWNYVAGIGNVLELQMEKLFDVYKQEFQLDEYATDEQKAYRELILSKLYKAKKRKSRK